MFHKTLLSTLVLVTSATSLANSPTPIDPLADLPFYNQTESGYSLDFDGKNYRSLETTVNGETIKFRAFEKIVYVKNPVEADYQTINFYVPEAYFNDQEINGFNANSAPIFLPNAVGGYMPAKAATYDKKGLGASDKPNAIQVALSKGYVVASVGARGRTLEKEGVYTGKAPAVIVDLKAAVRYLHANDSKMAGDANKIISNGTSAGGAVSALLGASGDSADYAEYLKQLGAAEASDSIFAVSAYCPIANLENADMAYEWEFNGVNQYSRMDMSRLTAQGFNDRSQPKPRIEGELSAEEIKLSAQQKAMFPAYLNSLNLKDKDGKPLTLDEQGNGSFKEYLRSIIQESAQTAYRQLAQNSEEWTNFRNQYSWLSFEKDSIAHLDWDKYIHSEKRMKSPLAFDALDLSTGENNLFGTDKINNQHFTDYAQQHSTATNASLADKNIVKLMNPMNYIKNKGSAEHWRIRAGTSDRDTSHAISAILAIKLTMAGKNVDYATPWGVPHSGDYDLDELFNWADSIVK
ncbi:subtype B tannase [Basfia succiniciproducens]|uniref:subtype B tannase n=1 Tax=Basfia succiniciproducens TaxID=653940 RepID=UPI0008BD01EB|nr:subtype B tannase [Basfia succiniciproducens]SEQ87831.1 hypothetical protein SAMN02910415_02197 [Basfia succiniciproducens]